MSARLAASSDAPEVIRLVNALLVELGGKPLEPARAASVYGELVARSELGFAALGARGDSSCAVCTVSLAHALRSGGRYAIVQEMYVEPARRSSGVGAEVLALVLAHARSLGCPFVELGTPLHGARQIAFYARSGFQSVGERLRCAL